MDELEVQTRLTSFSSLDRLLHSFFVCLSSIEREKENLTLLSSWSVFVSQSTLIITFLSHFDKLNVNDSRDRHSLSCVMIDEWEVMNDTYEHHLHSTRNEEQRSNIPCTNWLFFLSLFPAHARALKSNLREEYVLALLVVRLVRVERMSENKVVFIVERMACKGWNYNTTLSKRVLNSTHTQTRLSFFHITTTCRWSLSRM